MSPHALPKKGVVNWRHTSERQAYEGFALGIKLVRVNTYLSPLAEKRLAPSSRHYNLYVCMNL
jgi:hypothetical protein